jgi:hypothetical protein
VAQSAGGSVIRQKHSTSPLKVSTKSLILASRAADLERADVKRAATARRLRRPPSGDPLQKELEL